MNTQRSLRAFGQAIRAERQKLGLTQEELAELADVHPTYVSRVESAAKNVSFENIVYLAAALRLQPSQLFERAGL